MDEVVDLEPARHHAARVLRVVDPEHPIDRAAGHSAAHRHRIRKEIGRRARLEELVAKHEREGTAELVLDDGSEEELAYATLALGADGGLRCRVRGGRLTARLATGAQQVALERVDGDAAHDDLAAGASDGGHVLVAAGRRWPIAVR